MAARHAVGYATGSTGVNARFGVYATHPHGERIPLLDMRQSIPLRPPAPPRPL